MFIRGIRLAAAMVTISAPINENMVISIALSTAPKPLGHKAAVIPQPRNAAHFGIGIKPVMATAPSTINARIAITLHSASQNSNSP